MLNNISERGDELSAPSYLWTRLSMPLGRGKDEHKHMHLGFGLLKCSFRHNLYKGVVHGEWKVLESVNVAKLGRPTVWPHSGPLDSTNQTPGEEYINYVVRAWPLNMVHNVLMTYLTSFVVWVGQAPTCIK